MWLDWWESLVVSHHHAKFGGYRSCGSGDMLLVVEENDSRWSHFNTSLLSISKRHELKVESIRHIILVTPIPLHALKAAIGAKYENDFCQSIQKQCLKGEERNGYGKAFCISHKHKTVLYFMSFFKKRICDKNVNRDDEPLIAYKNRDDEPLIAYKNFPT